MVLHNYAIVGVRSFKSWYVKLQNFFITVCAKKVQTQWTAHDLYLFLSFSERKPSDPARTMLPSVHLKPMHSCWKGIQGTWINSNVLEIRAVERDPVVNILDNLKENEVLKQHIMCLFFKLFSLSTSSTPLVWLISFLKSTHSHWGTIKKH